MDKKKLLILTGAVLAAALCVGEIWYEAVHIFVDGIAYPKNAVMLDLRGTEASTEHYEAVRQAFPDCEVLWDIPFQGEFWPEGTRELAITTLTDEDVAQLDYFTQLKKVDARGCVDYTQLIALEERRPELDIQYTVAIDGRDYFQNATAVTIANFTREELELLQYLPELKYVDAEDCGEYALLMELQEQYPRCEVTYNVPVGDNIFSESTTELALTGVSTGELMEKLAYLPRVERVEVEELVGDGVVMPELLEAYPNIDFSWQMDVLGVTVTSQDTELDLSRVAMESVEPVEEALANFPELERLYLGRCGLDNEMLAEYRDRVRPEYKVVWNILIGAVYVDTDETWFMPGKYNKGLTEEQAHLLKYCEDMVCIDVGHKPLETCEWVRYMPNLKYLILADTNIEDMSPLSTCKNLVFLELFMSFVKDYTPLLGCTALEDLNIGSTWGDPEPLKQMTWLKRLWWPCHEKYLEEMQEALPNTELMFYSIKSDTGGGWRLGQYYYEQRDYMGVPYMGG